MSNRCSRTEAGPSWSYAHWQRRRTACASTIAIVGSCGSDEIIVEVRAYLDSALVQTLIDHNGLGTEVFKGISPRSHGAREFTEDLDICLP